MIDLFTRSAAWVLQNATLPDTLVMKTVPVQRGWFEIVTGAASAVLSLTILGLAIVLVPVAWSFWRSFRKVRELLDRLYADVSPLARHAGNIADNLDYISTSIRHDVQQVNATIAAANQRLHEAVVAAEDRLNDFNALLEVVQQEAEQAFVSTAAAVRGVRTGAATLGLTPDADATGDEDDGGIDDGNDDETDTLAYDEDDERSERRGRTARTSAGPRVRARRRG